MEEDTQTAADTGADSVAGSDTVVDAAHIESLGLDPTKVSADDPAITGRPRDELADSVDQATGTLTEEAQELRRQAAEDAAKAE